MMNKAYTFVNICEPVANRLYNKYKDMRTDCDSVRYYNLMKINLYEKIDNLGKNDELSVRKYLAEIRETSPQLTTSKQSEQRANKANNERTTSKQSEQRANKYGNYAQRDNPKRGRFI
jgi:hypothetical protein